MTKKQPTKKADPVAPIKQTTGFTTKSCWHDAEGLISIGKIDIGGAGRSGRDVSEKYTLLVDLDNMMWGYANPAAGLPEWVKPFANHAAPIVRVPWSDGAAPPVPLDFFRACFEQVAKSTDANPLLVYACMGGHGRTGTALAATLIAVCDMSASAAIALVRKAHCEKAVETTAQVKWLCDAAGKGETPEDCPPPSHRSVYSSGTGSAGISKALDPADDLSNVWDNRTGKWGGGGS